MVRMQSNCNFIKLLKRVHIGRDALKGVSRIRILDDGQTFGFGKIELCLRLHSKKVSTH